MNKKSGHYLRIIDKFGNDAANQERSFGAASFKKKKKARKAANASKIINR